MSAATIGVPTDQFVADLCWVVNSPSFLTAPEVAVVEPVAPGQVDGAALAAFLELREVRRVGRYFEALVLFWLEQVRRVTVVGHSVQIRDEHRTLGELDFLFVDEAGVQVHSEVSCKFYLHNPDRTGSHFPGPNPTDDFENKIGRLFNHQLEMSRTHNPEVERREALVRGRVFTHLHGDPPTQRPDRMSADCLGGSWLRADELTLLEQWDGAELQIADKPYWLSPMTHAPRQSVAEAVETATAHFAASDRTLMVAVHGAQSGKEERLCIVPADWDRARPKGPCQQ